MTSCPPAVPSCYEAYRHNQYQETLARHVSTGGDPVVLNHSRIQRFLPCGLHHPSPRAQ